LGIQAFSAEVLRHLRRASGIRPLSRVLAGGVTAVQRHGSSLNLNIHFHSLFLDGVYVWDPEGRRLEFRPLKEPTEAELYEVTERTAKRLERLLRRRGVHFEAGGSPEGEPPGALETLQAASLEGWTLMDERPHRVAVSAQGQPPLPGPKLFTASWEGFNLNAGTRIGARDREGLEKLCRYILRPAFGSERLELLGDGRIHYGFQKPRWDGAEGLLLSPLELLEKLAALVPPPRAHLLVYHGVLGPGSRARSRVVLGAPNGAPNGAPSCNGHGSAEDPLPKARRKRALRVLERERAKAVGKPSSLEPSSQAVAPRKVPPRPPSTAPPPVPADPSPPPRRRRREGIREERTPWAELLRRTFGLNVLDCPRCHGRMEPIASIEDPEVIRKILGAMGLPGEPPRASPAREIGRQLGFEFDQAG
jgi:hypothetical protein